jgi:diacylglycerol kinase family enzyme
MPTPLLILNPEAGGIRGDPRLLSSLQDPPSDERRGTGHCCGGADEVRALARQAREEGRPRLLVGGGDGTVHAVGEWPSGRPRPPRPPSCRVPPGTFRPSAWNGKRSGSIPGIPHAPLEGYGCVELALTRPMDLIRVEAPCDEWCVNAVAGGFAVTEEATPGAEAKAALGILAYLRRGLDALEGDPQLYDVSLTLDEGDRHAF